MIFHEASLVIRVWDLEQDLSQIKFGCICQRIVKDDDYRNSESIEVFEDWGFLEEISSFKIFLKKGIEEIK